VKEYILSDNTQPLILHGASGCGKTSVIAKITNQVSFLFMISIYDINYNFKIKILDIIENSDEYIIILRFLGTTPASSNITSTYKSIINQLSRLKDNDSTEKNENLSDFTLVQLKDKLVELFKLYKNKKIIILLDSIDQLVYTDYDLQWYVYHIYSVISLSNIKIVL
jgi:hypothetical protein